MLRLYKAGADTVEAMSQRQPYIWQVNIKSEGALTGVLLSYRRQLPDGRSIKFDEDPQTVLDLAAEQDERLLMDGVLALIPPGKLLSCAIRVMRLSVMLLGSRSYQHIFAEHDPDMVRRALEANGLYNNDGASGDAVLVGGERAAHSTPAVSGWARQIEQRVLKQLGPAGWIAPWAPVLEPYDAVIYTISGEISVVARSATISAQQARAALERVAAGHGVALPSQL